MRRVFGSVRMCGAPLLFVLGWSMSALAEAPSRPLVSVRLSATQAAPAAPVFVSAAGFQAGEQVAAFWEVPSKHPGRPVEQVLLAVAQADEKGVVAPFSIAFPPDTPGGQQLLQIKGTQSRRAGHVLLSVQANWEGFACSPKGRKTAP